MIPNFDVIQQYVPNVAPQTIAAIIRVESEGNPFAVGINGPVNKKVHPKSAQEAASQARFFISKGYSVDLGLMQINSRNLSALGLTVEKALDPRANIQAGAQILSCDYRGAMRRYGPGRNALRAALSAYNTGNYEDGFKNGYVAKYFPTSSVKSSTASIVKNVLPSHNILAAGLRRRIFARRPLSNRYIAQLPGYRRVLRPKPIA